MRIGSNPVAEQVSRPTGQPYAGERSAGPAVWELPDATVEALEEQGIQVEQYYAELGHGQQELSVAPRPALRAADTQILVRETIRGVAARSGLVASLAAKPWPDQAGNGAHIHFSMWDGDGRRNLFHDPAGRYGLSRTAEQFTAGVLEHAGAITAVVCPTVNSYKRMLPRGLMNEISWAPVYRAYGHNNRTLMCRLPMNRRCLELRIADSACNFYLGAAITLAAGLDGVATVVSAPGGATTAAHLRADEIAAARVASPPASEKAPTAIMTRGPMEVSAASTAPVGLLDGGAHFGRG